MERSKDSKFLMHGLVLVSILATAKSTEVEIAMEAAFQGHCGHTSPCEQLCYEIHDGMYECDCIEGYELNKNGYSCQVINSTTIFDGHSKSDEDVLYQKGASFSAKLANGSDHDNQLLLSYSPLSSMVGGEHITSVSSSISAASSSVEDVDGEEGNNFFEDDGKRNEEQTKVNSNDYYISSEDVYFTNGDDQKLTNTNQNVPELKDIDIYQTTVLGAIAHNQIVETATTDSPYVASLNKKSIRINLKSQSIPNLLKSSTNGNSAKPAFKNTQNISTTLQNKMANNHLIGGYLSSGQNTYQDQSAVQAEDPSNSKSITNKNIQIIYNTITDKLNLSRGGRTIVKNTHLCDLDCGAEGKCERIANTNRCVCPFGKNGKSCSEDIKIRTPKFSKHSWLAFSALRGAYKHVQIRIEFRPESFDGIILLSGERDDFTGDFMTLLLNKGFVEFWFDCGSGIGTVRSRETILLNEWNSVIIYRHRWDAWLVLNHGTKSQGRSNGLFSRITFREPVFLGGTGNITGLAKRLPVYNGFMGCIRRFVANEHDYKFDEHPLGDVTKGFGIQDCVTDKCFTYPCQHGGKCLPSEQGALCLCPIGFVGDLCEIRMDLQVPAFNGSSYLRYAPLGDSALIWLELKIILKSEQPEGLILFSGSEEHGDFIALWLSGGFVVFIFNLGSGPAFVRSEYPLTIGQWHSIKISRTARLAVLKIDMFPEVMTISPNGFWHLSLRENLFLGGVDHVDKLPVDLRAVPFFVGCIQKVDINVHPLSIISEALGGTNIGNCPHACVARPCGPLAECIPQMESYECRCNTFSNQCNKTAQVATKEIQTICNNSKSKNKDKVKTKSVKHHYLPKNTKMSHTSKFNGNKVPLKYLKYPTMAMTTLAEPKLSSNRDSFAHNLSKVTSGKPFDIVDDVFDKKDDILIRDARRLHGHKDKHVQHSKQSSEFDGYKGRKQTENKQIGKESDFSDKPRYNGRTHDKGDRNHKDVTTFDFKLSRIPTHYESFQSNQEMNVLTFDENVDIEIGVDQSSNKENTQNEDNESYESDNDSGMWDQSKEDTHNMKLKWKYHEYGNNRGHSHDAMNEETKSAPFFVDETLFNKNSAEDYHRKELEQNMQRILGNGPESDANEKELKLVVDEYVYDKMDGTTEDREKFINDQNKERIKSNLTEKLTNNTTTNDELLEPVQTIVHENVTKVNLKRPKCTNDTQTDWSLLKKLKLPAGHQSRFAGVRKNFGACFAGQDSYFHYNDVETMRQINNYNVDMNLRIKTHSQNGVILWTGPKSSTAAKADFLSLGIENGYLHFRYDLGSGAVDIECNVSRVSDGLWHRVRAIRDSQAGHLEMDGRKTITQHSPGKLKQLNTDAGLYVGGMPNAIYFTRRKYKNGFVGCISEIVLAGVLKLNFDGKTLGTGRNVETGLL
ncbi:basement membrane proteoglycan [Eurosta solidaginis]|uniref:basement membrane proteoglycan n=1 Tax=Eurosta solidaginis TaxID=178769 RepID=UPI003530F64E